MKYFSLYGPNNSDSIVFRNAAFGEIKDHSLRTTPFQKKKKKIAMEVFKSTNEVFFSLWLK